MRGEPENGRACFEKGVVGDVDYLVALDKGEQNSARVEAAKIVYYALDAQIAALPRNSAKQKLCRKVRTRVHAIMNRKVGHANVSRQVRCLITLCLRRSCAQADRNLIP